MKSVSIKFGPEGQPLVVTKPTAEDVREQLTGKREPKEAELHDLEQRINNSLGRSATTRREIRRVLQRRRKQTPQT
ncbi:MAG TPA: hypothetical protein VN711_02270 [Candidatus Saccharimonadales bacterium]|nr:hypothetical protein [Candidatus Saccharimonadales bacterium]